MRRHFDIAAQKTIARQLAAFAAGESKAWSRPGAKTLLRALKNARTDRLFVATIEKLAALAEDTAVRALLWVLAIEHRRVTRTWAGFSRSVRAAEKHLAQIRGADERDLLQNFLFLARGMRLRELRRHSQAREFFERLAAGRGYFAHMGHAYLGLYALEAGDVAEALRRLVQSAAVPVDETLQLRGYTEVLYMALESRGVSTPELESYALLPLGAAALSFPWATRPPRRFDA